MENRIKVLFISHEDGAGGAPRALMELLCSYLEKKEVLPVVLTPVRNELNEFCDQNNIENYSILFTRSVHDRRRLIPSCLMYLPRIFKHEIIGLLALKRLSKKLNLSSFDLIDSNTSVIDFGLTISKKFHIKHVCHLREFGDLDFKLKANISETHLVKQLNNYTDAFIAISREIKKYWVKRGLPESKIELIYDGVQVGDIDRKIREDYFPKEQLKILMTGTIRKFKGQDQLVQAISNLSDDIKSHLQVDIFGREDSNDIGYLKNIRKIIQEKELGEVVTLKGYRENIRHLIKDYDLGIICSKSEGFGRVTAEYMLAGLAVIGANTGATPEIIDDGINGYLYEYGNIEDLSEKIGKIYGDRDLILKFGQNGSDKILNHFTVDINSQKIYNLYIKLCD